MQNLNAYARVLLCMQLTDMPFFHIENPGKKPVFSRDTEFQYQVVFVFFKI